MLENVKNMAKQKELELEELRKSGVAFDEEKEKKKLQYLKQAFEDEQIFFKIQASEAIPILNYLGVPKENLKAEYFKLISPSQFQMKNVAILDESKSIK